MRDTDDIDKIGLKWYKGVGGSGKGDGEGEWQERIGWNWMRRKPWQVSSIKEKKYK